jgi:hypothetical protein
MAKGPRGVLAGVDLYLAVCDLKDVLLVGTRYDYLQRSGCILSYRLDGLFCGLWGRIGCECCHFVTQKPVALVIVAWPVMTIKRIDEDKW